MSTTSSASAPPVLLPPSSHPHPRNFDFPEKEEVNKYYPQYYHKIDKVGAPARCHVPRR